MSNFQPDIRFDHENPTDNGVDAEVVDIKSIIKSEEINVPETVEDPTDVDLSFDNTFVTDALSAYMQKMGGHKIMTKAQEVKLAKRVERGEEGAKDEFIELNLKLVISTVRKYEGQGLELIDLIQEGNEGLIRAVEKFDWRRGFKFSTYATWWIRQAATRAVINKGTTIRIPVHVAEMTRKVKDATRFLELEGVLATPEAIAKELGVEPVEVQALLDIDKGVLSLDKPLGIDDDSGATFGSLVEDEDVDVEREVIDAIRIEEIEKLIETHLTPNESIMFKMYYGLGEYHEKSTYEEVGKVFGLTRSRVQQIIMISKKKLAKQLLRDNPKYQK